MPSIYTQPKTYLPLARINSLVASGNHVWGKKFNSCNIFLSLPERSKFFLPPRQNSFPAGPNDKETPPDIISENVYQFSQSLTIPIYKL